jgi:hypothetical protein
MLKIIFFKKYYFIVFLSEKYFKKQLDYFNVLISKIIFFKKLLF